MKHLKKLASVLLALVMALALMAPAFAYDAEANAPAIKVKDHDFYAFQLFKGEPVVDGAKYFKEPIAWGDDLNTGDLQRAFVNALIDVCQMDDYKAVFDTPADGNDTVRAQLNALMDDGAIGDKAGEVANLLALMYDEYDSARSRDISDAIWNVFVSAFPNTMVDYEIKAGIETTDGKASPYGYYLLHDKAEAVTGQANILLVHTNSTGSTVVPKTTPDNNDLTKQVVSAEIPGSWTHATAYQIGDEVPFRIIAPIPGSFATDNTTTGNGFEMNFVDTPDDGLLMSTNQADYTLTVYSLTGTGADFEYGGKTYKTVEAPAGGWPFTFNVATQPGTNGGGEFHFDITNMKADSSAYKNLSVGDLIVISYNATFKGVLKDDGTIDVEYSNKVNLKYTGNDEPLEDEDKLYSFELDINKTDGESEKPLTGAKFSLYQQVAAGTTGAVTDLKHPVTGETLDGSWMLVDTIDGKAVEADGETLSVEAKSTFKFDDLKAGNYMLIEDEVPEKDPDGNEAHYNKIPPKYYVIAAAYTAEAKKGAQVLQSVKLYETDSTFSYAGKEPIASTTQTDATMAAGSLVAAGVENNQGTLLPETGGIGTTIFYIVGGVLVLGAVVLLITKRRASADDE